MSEDTESRIPCVGFMRSAFVEMCQLEELKNTVEELQARISALEVHQDDKDQASTIVVEGDPILHAFGQNPHNPPKTHEDAP